MTARMNAYVHNSAARSNPQGLDLKGRRGSAEQFVRGGLSVRSRPGPEVLDPPQCVDVLKEQLVDVLADGGPGIANRVEVVLGAGPLPDRLAN